jgi:hypothetical protein
LSDTLFARIGRLLYGDEFIPTMVDTLGITKRTVQRWAHGSREVPPVIWGRLIELMREEREVLDEESAQLKSASADAARVQAELLEEIRQARERAGNE